MQARCVVPRHVDAPERRTVREGGHVEAFDLHATVDRSTKRRAR